MAKFMGTIELTLFFSLFSLVLGSGAIPTAVPESNLTFTNATRFCLNGSLIMEVRENISIICDNDNVNFDNSSTGEEQTGDTRRGYSADYVGYVIVPLFLILGICGNSLTIIVMSGKKFRSMTSSLILIAIAVSDTTFSCVVPFNKKFLRNMVGYDVRALTPMGCSIFFIIHKIAKMSSSWFTVFICFERFVAVWFPLKTKFICTRRNTLIGIAAVYIGMLILNIFWDFATKIVKGVCVPNYATPENAALARMMLILGTFLYSLIPVSLMLILTPAICYKLFSHARMRKKMASKQDDKQDETAKTTVMLMGVTFAFIILVTPVSIAHNISFTYGVNFFDTTDYGMVVVREVLQVMEQLNYSINFFMYVLCSRAFRHRVGELLGCKSLMIRRRATQTSVTMTTKVSTVSKNYEGINAKGNLNV